MDPTALPSGNLRPATITNVPRLASIATASLFYSPAFAWERKKHHQYPEDTIKSYMKLVADFIRDPESILLVVEDSYQPDENTKTGATIPPNVDGQMPQPGESVVVGFVAWKVPLGSKYIGHFMDAEGFDVENLSEFDGGPGRDKSSSLSLAVQKLALQEKEKYFQGRILIELVAIHPAYWRRGHGKSLLNWGLTLAEKDGVNTGVIANTAAVGLYLALGFVKIGKITLEDEEEPPNKVDGILLTYDTPKAA